MPLHLKTRITMNWGGEDFQALRVAILNTFPGSTVRVTELREDQSPRSFVCQFPVAGAYDETCTKVWSDFLRVVRSTWTREQYEENLYSPSYVVVDGEREVHHLTRRQDPGGHRDYIEGEAVECGTGIDLLRGDGTWLHGRYEMAWGSDNIPVPMFYFPLWRTDAAIPITEHMVVRRTRRT